MSIISLDTETTGLDLYHGCGPFMVSIHTDGNELPEYWLFPVNPRTRLITYNKSYIEEIEYRIETADKVILHNAKFDIGALKQAKSNFYWDWSKVEDTLIAGHLLASNRPHDLTSMGIQYLGVDISKYEKDLEKVVVNARKQAPSYWKLAKVGVETIPSAKGQGKLWRNDYWVPHTLYNTDPNSYPDSFNTALVDYGNADTMLTLALWKKIEKEMKRRNLDKIYRHRMKLVPIIHDMERRGVTLSLSKMLKLGTEYKEDSDNSHKICINIAKQFDYDLELPAGAVNNSLRDFCYDKLKLPYVYDKKSKTASPTLNKAAMDHYLEICPPKSLHLSFLRNLASKRVRDTALAYMESYRRFWIKLPNSEDTYRLHPFLNPTGTDTLRCTSSNPNEQNISKKEGFNLRYMFGPEEGYEWYSMDAKNIELRLPFYKSGEQSLIDLFEHPDDPPFYGSNHLLNFSVAYPDIWKKELDEVGIEKVGPHCKKKYASTWYQWCKNGGFALQYQAGKKTADAAFHRDGSYDLIKGRFTKLTELNAKCVAYANKYGYIETMPDKTVDPDRGYPLLCTRTDTGKVLETIPLSYYIQGTAMQWTCKAMVRCHEQIEKWNKEYEGRWDASIVMQIHDEIVFRLKKSNKPNFNLTKIKILKMLMEQGGDDIGIPTPVGVELHVDNWSEGVTLNL